MKPETKYKLTALGFFFVLFTGFFLQFISPYYVSFEPADWSGNPKAPVLRDNYFVPVFIAFSLALVAYQWILYRQVKHQVKLFPLIGSSLLPLLLAYIHFVNQAHHLDYETWSKIMNHLGAWD